jgi:hypothetical protein
MVLLATVDAAAKPTAAEKAQQNTSLHKTALYSTRVLYVENAGKGGAAAS